MGVSNVESIVTRSRQYANPIRQSVVGQFEYPQSRFSIPPVPSLPMTDILKAISKPAAWGSGWTSAILCFSAASGYWIAGEHKRAIFWIMFGVAEVGAILL